MKIYTTPRAEDYIGKIYTNYDLAYNGEHFNESFLKI